MTYEYTIGSREFNASQKLYLRHKLWARLLLISSYCLPPLLMLVTGWGQLYGMHLREEEITAGTVVEWLFPAVFFLLFIRSLRWWTLRRSFRALLPKGQTKSTIATFSFDDQTMTIAIPGKVEARYFWSSIVDFAEDEKMAIFFPQRNFFNMVAKDAIPESDWERIRLLLPKDIKCTWKPKLGRL